MRLRDLLSRTPRSIPPWLVLLLIFEGAVPALAFGLGLPHTARAGLAAGGVKDFAAVAAQLTSGVRPYSPGFHGALPFIYPPLTLPFLIPPLLGGTNGYPLAFAIEMLLMMGVGAMVLEAVWQRTGRPPGRLAWPVAATLAAVGPVTFYRTDLVIGMLLAGAILAWTRRAPAVAFLVVLVAGLIKEYAWVALIPLLAAQLRGTTLQARSLLEALRPLLLAAVPILLLLAGVEVWSQGGLLHSQLENLNRGVEVESLPAAVGIVLGGVGGITVKAGALGSMQISAPHAHLAAISLGFAVLGVLALALIGWRTQQGRLGLAAAVALALGVSLAATPVLSPQYFDALAPCICVACLTSRSRLAPAVLWATLGLALLTQAEFPYLWPSVLRLQPAGLIPLELRNLLLLGALATLAVSAWRAGEPQAEPARELQAVASPATT